MKTPAFRHHWPLAFLFCALTLLAACQPTAPVDGAIAVIKGDSDRRSYRYVELPNQLRVLLISAPDTDKAAAALDVNVGSRQDAPDRPGLAHFLEHMLFLGTDKYPRADEYQDFIAAHGGSHNAFTSFEHTNYFFDVNSEHLQPALDRFARFFVAPLFSAEYVEREKNAVDSEYQANLQNDPHRQLDVLREAVNPAHPFSKFSVGNLNTLGELAGKTVRDDLLEFYRQYYSANLMTLVVVGREPLDTLEQMVRSRFAAVPNHNRVIEPIAVPLYTEQQLPQLVQLQPVQQQRTLALAWPLPDQSDDYRGKSLEYIGNILGHEGSGSLLSALKQRGWAQALSAGQGLDYQGGSQFNIGIELTPEGSRHIDAIVQLVYEAIARIRTDGIQQWLYQEQHIVNAQRFRFRETPEPITEASRLAGNLHEYPAAEVIRGDYLMEQFEPEKIAGLLARLQPERMAMMYSSPDAVTDTNSKYYATPYSISTPSAQQLQQWRSATAGTTVQLPEPNIFISAQPTVKQRQDTVEKPRLLRDGEGLHLWFLQDGKFRLPKAAVTLEVLSPNIGDSVESAAQSELLVRVLRENLNEFSYPASLAGLNYDIGRNGRGIVVRIDGFDEKQSVLLERMLRAMKQPRIDADTFTRVHREYRRQLEDNIKATPYQLLMAELPDVLIRKRWPDDALLHATGNIERENLQRFAVQAFANIDIDMLVYGNVVEAEARRLGDLVAAQLLTGSVVAPRVPVEILHAAEADYRRAIDAPHNDAGLLWYRQAADNSKMARAALGVSAQVIGADFYSQLRTEQQLGYIVMASVYPVRDVPGLVFLVQSPVAGPGALAAAYQKFLREWSQRSEVELQPLFERHREALVQRLAQEPKNMGEANDRLWQDLASGHREFDSREQILAAMKALTFEQWLTLFRRDVLAPDGRAIWLTSNGRFAADKLLPGTPIESLERFKAEQLFYRFE